MRYKINKFVANLEDADMIYWTLMPYDFSVQPSNVYIKIYSNEYICKHWEMNGSSCYLLT